MIFYYKVWQLNFVGFFVILLQSVTVCYYKMPQVLQSVTDFITKCARYYKNWQLLTVTKIESYKNWQWDVTRASESNFKSKSH